VVTSLVMSRFFVVLDESRCCTRNRDSTAVFRIIIDGQAAMDTSDYNVAITKIYDLPVLECHRLKQLQNDIDKQSLAAIFIDFIEETQKRSDHIDFAIAEQNIIQLEFEVHALKGESSMWGARQLNEVAKLTEEVCKKGEIKKALWYAKHIDAIISKTVIEIQNYFQE